jgi:segregation and condensation protein A
MNYIIKLDEFEGPLDLLTFLIEKDEVDIYDIPIADITRQYLQYIQTWKDLQINIASEYFQMASYLLHIKSEMILFSESDDDRDEIDPRDELVSRLIEYKKFKKASDELEKLYNKSSSVLPRNVGSIKYQEYDWNFDEELNKYDLMVLLQSILLERKPKKPISVVITLKDIEEVSLKIFNILSEETNGIISLKELLTRKILNGIELRLRLVLLIVSILEMIRENRIFINIESTDDYYIGIKNKPEIKK